jgi:uncharacterized membrane protein
MWYTVETIDSSAESEGGKNVNKNQTNIIKITGLGLLTAMVIVLQMLGSFIHFGMFSVSLVLIPIVVGTALFGVVGGSWLGFVFGLTVLITGDANAFLAISVPGTVITVLCKGTLAGLASGLVYRLLEKKSALVATLVAAVVCPIVNTGIFVLGCVLFFMDTITAWANGANVAIYMIFGLGVINFIPELLINLVFSPSIVQVVKIGKKKLLK